MASTGGRRRCQSPSGNRPNMSEIRVILLGMKCSDISIVGNRILGRDAFEIDTPLSSVKQQSERARGTVEGRYITLINTPHLFDTEVSQEELTQRVKECVSLCAPGPHGIVLILQMDNFTERDRNRVHAILSTFSEEALNYTMVLTTLDMEPGTSVDPGGESIVQEVIVECRHRHLDLSRFSSAAFVELMEGIVKENGGSLTCEIYEEATEPLDDEETEDQEEHCPTEKLLNLEANKPTKMSVLKEAIKKRFTPKKRLNMVLFGREDETKARISQVLLGKSHLGQRGVCVKRTGEVSGRPITLVEMPALCNTQLSEEELISVTRRCVLMCDRNVHAFLLIIPEAHLTDDDKQEMETIQRIFGHTINNHMLVVIHEKSRIKSSDKTLLAEIETWGKQHVFFSAKTDVEPLIACCEKLLTENKGKCYTMDMYLDAQVERQLQYERENENLRQIITDLRKRDEKQESPDTLRIVLLGKTGVGKSATGNTILGKAVFNEELSDSSVTVLCQKETTEISGRQITVIDTPGLFDTDVANIEITKEITKCISMAAPGPHVFLLVLNVSQRFTQEEIDTVNLIKETFGEKFKMYTVVVFTRGDQLKGKTIEQYVEQAGSRLKKQLYEFGNRFHVLNNSKECYTQVTDLLNKIDSMVAVNAGCCYTNEMFEQVEKDIQQEQKRILKEREEEIEKEKEELKAKCDADIEKMTRFMEEERQNKETEWKKKEDEIKKREEQLQHEMELREQLGREENKKRREEDEKRINEWMAEINREREENKHQWQRQREEEQRWREQEDKERKQKEEEWKEKQKEEREKFEREKEEMMKNENEALIKLQKEFEQKAAEEKERRKDLEEQMKHAEENKKKELQELQSQQQQDWDRKMQEVEKRKKEEAQNWMKRISSLENDWDLQRIRKEKQYHWEKEREKAERELKEKERQMQEEKEKKRIEEEANKKIRKIKEDFEAKREREEEERKEKDKQLRKDMEEQLRVQQEDFRKKCEDEEKLRSEDEKRNLNFIKETHIREMENLKRQVEKTTRKQAEEEFCAKLEGKVKEAKEIGFSEGCAKVESERTVLGRGVDRLINSVCGSKQDKAEKNE